MESPEINPYIHNQLIFHKGTQDNSIQWGKIVYKQVVLGMPMCKEKSWIPSSQHILILTQNGSQFSV